MNRRIVSLAGSLALCVALSLSLGGGTSLAAGETSLQPVALLELFTSQGCSSCPPADELLSRMAADPAWSGRVVPIAFHVDYWNYIGWTDPFSRRAWSERQERYASAFDSDRIYTPQLIVQGRQGCNGTDSACIRRALEHVSSPGSWSIDSVRLDRVGTTLQASVGWRGVTGSAGPTLYGALVERGLETSVARGENARRTLHNDNVVRLLASGRKVQAPRESELTFELDPRWQKDRLGLVIFLQELPSMAVLTAVRVPASDLAIALMER